MSTLHEIKAAAAGERAELESRREQLVQEIEAGLRQIERGEVAPLDIEEIKRKARGSREDSRCSQCF